MNPIVTAFFKNGQRSSYNIKDFSYIKDVDASDSNGDIKYGVRLTCEDLVHEFYFDDKKERTVFHDNVIDTYIAYIMEVSIYTIT